AASARSGGRAKGIIVCFPVAFRCAGLARRNTWWCRRSSWRSPRAGLARHRTSSCYRWSWPCRSGGHRGHRTWIARRPARGRSRSPVLWRGWQGASCCHFPRYAGSSPSSSGMRRCPRRRRLSAPNSASTDAVRSRIALSTPSLVPSSAKAAASTDESAARSSPCDRCWGSILIMALASASARLRASSSFAADDLHGFVVRFVDFDLVHQLPDLLPFTLLLHHQFVVSLLRVCPKT